MAAVLAADGARPSADSPRPSVAACCAAGFVVCRRPGRPLTVELDSFRFHRSRHAWEADRDRERAARARGDELRRYTWRDVVEDPGPPLTDLAGLLAEI